MNLLAKKWLRSRKVAAQGTMTARAAASRAALAAAWRASSTCRAATRRRPSQLRAAACSLRAAATRSAYCCAALASSASARSTSNEAMYLVEADAFLSQKYKTWKCYALHPSFLGQRLLRLPISSPRI